MKSCLVQAALPRKGAVVVLAAVLMIPVMAFVAFTVDVGYLALEKSRLQATADACALAGVPELPQMDAVAAVAQQYAELNYHHAENILNNEDLEPGIWDEDTRTFTPSDPAVANALRLTVRRSQENGNSLNLFFAPVIGIQTASVSARATAIEDPSLCGGLIGLDHADLTGTAVTDSYDSTEGLYDPATAGDKGNVCSNGPITVSGNAYVNGDARPGPGETTTIVGSATVTGNTDPRDTEFEMPPVDTSEVETNNDNDRIDGPGSPLDANRNFTLVGQSCDLPPGTYYFNDMTVSGQSTLNLSGETKIYLTGNLDTAGGDLVNSTLLPAHMKIFMTGGTAKFIGNADFYGVVYAPDTDVTITGTGSLYGAAVGRTLTLSGTGDVHFDESLDLSDDVNTPKKLVLVE